MKRGIITNPAKMDRTSSQSVSISGSISSSDLNYYLLYWDKIVMPTNNIIHIAINNEDQLLKTQILERPRIAFSSWSSNTQDGSYDPFVIAQSIVANNLISTDKSFDWTIHQIGDGIAIGNEQKKDFNSIKVELLQSLPVPGEGINFQEILNFKEKRSDELLELHSAIDELYLDILSSPDKDLKTRKVISDLKNSIDNLDSVSKEKFNTVSKYNFTTELNLNGKDLGMAIAGGAVFDSYTNGFSVPIGTVVSGLLSIIKIKANRTTSVEKAQDKLKLSYLASANKMQII